MPSFIRSLERIRVRSWSPSLMLPCRASTRPTSDFRKVVLPAPLAPSSNTVSPARTSRSTPHSTCMVPYPASMRLACNSGAASGDMLASQEDLDHLRFPHSRGELAFEDLLAGVEHDD